MKLESQPRSPANDDNLIPLINIVFLLLIFFMLSGSFSKSTPFEITPPHSKSEAAVHDQPIILHVAADGSLALNDSPIELSALNTELEARFANDVQPHVQLKADMALEAASLLDVIDALKASGAKQMTLLTVVE